MKINSHLEIAFKKLKFFLSIASKTGVIPFESLEFKFSLCKD